MKNFISQNQPIVLASGSKMRFELLSALGLDLIVSKSCVNEEAIKISHRNQSFENICSILAQEKAAEVSKQFNNHLIIGGDQICLLDQQLISKAKSKLDAINQLKQMQNKSHTLYSSACLYFNKKIIWSGVEKAVLTMRKLNEKQIVSYLEQDQPFSACGSYQYELNGKYLFSKVTGSFECILGLPLHKLITQLLKHNFICWQ